MQRPHVVKTEEWRLDKKNSVRLRKKQLKLGGEVKGRKVTINTCKRTGLV